MGMLKEIIKYNTRTPENYSIYKALVSAKEVHDFKVNDIHFTDISVIRDYEDKIVNLSLNCTEYTQKLPSFDTTTFDPITKEQCPIYTTNKRVATPSNPIEIVFPLWEDQLKNIWYLYKNHRVLYDELLIHYSETLWNGFCETPLAHINKFKIDEKKKTVTLWRFYRDMIDVCFGNENGDGGDYMNTHPGMTKVDMNLSKLTPIEVSIGNYNYANNVVKKTYSGISSIQVTTANISFDVNIDKNESRFNSIINDPEFVKFRIPKEGELLEVFLKDEYSKDTTMIFNSIATKVWKRDVHEIELFNDIKRGYLERSGEDNEKYVFVTESLLGTPTENINLIRDGLRLESLNNADINAYVTERYDHTELASGNLYVFFKDQLCHDVTAKIAAHNVPVYQYTKSISHNDIVSRSFRIDETTPVEYNAIKNIYTYRLEFGKNIDDSEKLTWSVSAESLRNSILYAGSKDNVITIISLVKLGGTKVVNTGLVTISGHYHWVEVQDVFDYREMNLEIRHNDINLIDDKLCCIIPYDIEHISHYSTEYEELDSFVSGSYQFYSYGSEVSEICDKLYNMIYDYYIDEKKKLIYIKVDQNKYDELFKDHPFSRISCNFNYEYKDIVVYPDVEFEEDVKISAKFIPEKEYKWVRKEIINGIEYFVYNFYLYYNYRRQVDLPVKKDITYDEFYGKSMVYDVVYRNGNVDIFLLTDVLYSDIKISFYIGEFDHVTIDNYETYTLTDKAYDKFITLIRDSALKYDGMIGNSPKYDINY